MKKKKKKKTRRNQNGEMEEEMEMEGIRKERLVSMLPADHCGEKKLIHHVTAPIPDELFLILYSIELYSTTLYFYLVYTLLRYQLLCTEYYSIEYTSTTTTEYNYARIGLSPASRSLSWRSGGD